jgi:bacteriocin-like protein
MQQRSDETQLVERQILSSAISELSQKEMDNVSGGANKIIVWLAAKAIIYIIDHGLEGRNYSRPDESGCTGRMC